LKWRQNLARFSLYVLLCAFLATSAVAAEDPFPKLIAKRQYVKAVALLVKSARQGNPLSQYRLAVMLRSGLGTKRDEPEARIWLKKSSASGNAKAAQLLKRLSLVTASDGISATPKAPLRSAKVAVLAGLPRKPTAAPSWTEIASARNFDSLGKLSFKDDIGVADAGGGTALIAATRAGNRSLANELINAGADLNAADSRGLTALHWAAQRGNAQLFDLLLAAKADTTRVNATGETAALLSAKLCNVALFEAAHSQFRTNLVTAGGASTAHLIVQNCDHPQLFATYLDGDSVAVSDNFDRTPLWYAVDRGSLAMSAYLLKFEGFVATPDRNGVTPLHLAASRGEGMLVSMLLEKGAVPEALDVNQNTPLMLAAASTKSNTVALLLSVTTDINRKNIDGETALLLAVKSGNVDVIRQLVAAGASPTSRTNARDTPEKIAERLGLQGALQTQN
jgi:ankyrin repeat protein